MKTDPEINPSDLNGASIHQNIFYEDRHTS